jgi:glycosyltransferase involved in cell wall biosynthesis
MYMQKRPEISVIVPALNEEKYITNVLEGLKNQTFRNFEVIVADNNSSDATREIARRYKAKVVVEKRRGVAINRNTGSRAARAGLLVFLDADTKPSERLLESYHRVFKDREIVAATGPILPLEKANKRTNIGFRLVSILFVRLSILFNRPSIVGINFAVRKNIFNKVGGFNEHFVTYEDWDLSLRLRKEGKIAYVKGALARTSIRRVKAWGVHGFFFYHTGNILRYNLLKKHPKDDYELIR